MGRVIRAQRIGPARVPAVVHEAMLEAQAIRARAEQAAQSVQRDAYETGLAAGHAEAAKLLLELAQQQNALLARTEREATQAVLLVAAELLGATLHSQPEQILQLLTPHLTRMRRARQIVLHLHPDDSAWLHDHTQALRDLCRRHGIEGEITLQHDPKITRGGCLLESNLGGLDARIETRLELLARALGLDAAKDES